MLRNITKSYLHFFAESKKPIRVSVTGASGQIGYSILFRIANGDMLGYDQPIILQLIDIPQAQKALSGVAMQLRDCTFPLLKDIICTDKLEKGFKDTQIALLIGGKPTARGMQRRELLQQNASIFISQGRALNDYANRNVKTLIVANPANTLCLITATHAKDLPKQNFAALTKLDHDRAVWQVAQKTGSSVQQIKKVVVWGNHSRTIFPDLTYATINGKSVMESVGDEWYQNVFVPKVKHRFAEIMDARGVTSGASAANAAITHMRSWIMGENKNWVSFGVWSNGNPYQIPENIFYSFPVTVENRKWKIVNGLTINSDQRSKMQQSANDLLNERKSIQSLLKI